MKTYLRELILGYDEKLEKLLSNKKFITLIEQYKEGIHFIVLLGFGESYDYEKNKDEIIIVFTNSFYYTTSSKNFSNFQDKFNKIVKHIYDYVTYYSYDHYKNMPDIIEKEIIQIEEIFP